MYAVEGKDFTELTVNEVLDKVEKWDCKRVCITGGEPLIQRKEAEALAEELAGRGYSILLETSGHKMPPPVFWTESSVVSMDCKCPGSGMQDRMDFTLFTKLRPRDQLKFVIQDEADYDYAVGVISKYDIKANIIFQPAGGLETGWIAEKIMQDCLGGVRVLPQLHKLLWGDKSGV